MATALPCVAQAQVAARINSTSYRWALASSVVLWVLLLTMIALFVEAMSMRLRAKVRQLFQIPGNLCMDFCLSCWCSPCTIAQIASHVQSYEPGRCDFGAPDSLPAYC
ncbi:TPA: hypothetical protein N0F65_009188 [Lagenidium giganteum]|uniref:Uncharacterized protein n=1 Tax=Lagenidium giganteum TaxID=4803 RepID=A0AAV2YMD9_9STRA|nr:TPA: hypothetical protein N0F65_009188 [Lagenidium giganteum]